MAQNTYYNDSTVVIEPRTVLDDNEDLMVFSGDLKLGNHHLIYAPKMRFDKTQLKMTCLDCDYTFYNSKDTFLLNHVNFELDLESQRAHLTFLKSGSTVDLNDFGVLVQYQENWFYINSVNAGYSEPNYDGRNYRFGKNTLVTKDMSYDSVIVRSMSLSVDMQTHEIHVNGVARVFLNDCIIYTDSNGLVYNSKGAFDLIKNALVVFSEKNQLHLLKYAEVEIKHPGVFKAKGKIQFEDQWINGIELESSMINGEFVPAGMTRIKKSQGFHISDKGHFWGKAMVSSLRPGVTFIGKIKTKEGVKDFSDHLVPRRKIEIK